MSNHIATSVNCELGTGSTSTSPTSAKRIGDVLGEIERLVNLECTLMSGLKFDDAVAGPHELLMSG